MEKEYEGLFSELVFKDEPKERFKLNLSQYVKPICEFNDEDIFDIFCRDEDNGIQTINIFDDEEI